MKLLPAILLLFSLAVPAQEVANPSAGSKVTVVQKKWRLEVRNPALDRDPVSSMKERQGEDRRRKDTERTNEILTERGMPAPTSTVPAPAPETASRGIRVSYVYEAKVTNHGDKRIRKLVWDYVFFEPGTEIEVGRRRFVNSVSIGPGKTSKLVFRSASSPTGTIDASNAGKKLKDQYTEQVVIQGVEYADGSVWQAVPN